MQTPQVKICLDDKQPKGLPKRNQGKDQRLKAVKISGAGTYDQLSLMKDQNLIWDSFQDCPGSSSSIKTEDHMAGKEHLACLYSEADKLIWNLILSTLFYSCESWTLTAELERRIQVPEIRIEPRHVKSNKMSAPSEDSNQPGHPLSLIRVFAVRMKKAWVLIYPISAQRRLWLDWEDAQADPSLRWAHTHFVGFVISQLKYYRRLLNISYKVRVTNEEVLGRIQNATGVHVDLLTTVKKAKLRWYGNISNSSGTAKTILQDF